MIKLFHRISAILPTGHRKRNGSSKMVNCNLKKFKLDMKKKNNYLQMGLGYLLTKKEKFKTVRFID